MRLSETKERGLAKQPNRSTQGQKVEKPMSQNTPALTKYAQTVTARARNWAALSDEDLRRTVTKAANERNAAELWSVTEAYLVLHSNRGTSISRHTLDNYERGIRVLLQHWHGENLIRPSRDAARQFVMELQETGLAPGSIQVRLAAARLLYRALRWAGVTTAAPFADVKAPHDPTPAEEKRQAYPEADVTRLLESAELVDQVLILLAAHGGLRVAEALALDWAAVDLNSGTLRVVHGKGGKTRTVHLSGSLSATLSAWQAHSGATGHVLPYRTAARARQRLQAVCAAAGVPYLGVHSLRHTCGTRMYRVSGDLRIAARHLGHASTSTTQVYAKMSTSDYAAAVGKL